MKWNLHHLARVLVLATFASGAAMGCDAGGTICTAVACSDGVQVRIESSADAGTNALPDGDYLVSVEIEGARHSATCHVRANPIDPAVKCDPPDNVVRFDVDTLIHLFVDGTPKELKLTVVRGDSPATSLTLTPAYQDFTPNGPQCSPVCRKADIELRI